MTVNRDIVKEIHDGTTSIDEVYRLYDAAGPTVVSECWGLSNVEWTAFCQSAGFEDLVNWRYAGWPTKCSICGQDLPKLNEYGWFVWDESERAAGADDGPLGLVHIHCLPIHGEEDQEKKIHSQDVMSHEWPG